MERRPSVGVIGKLLAPKDAVECHILELVFDGRQLICKRRTCHERDLPPDGLIFEERIENTGVSVVSWPPEKHLLAMAVAETKLEGRFIISVSKLQAQNQHLKGGRKPPIHSGSSPLIFSSAHSLPHPASIKSHVG